MGKAKAAKAATSISNKPAHIRVSYLYQAAAFLAQTRLTDNKSSDCSTTGTQTPDLTPASRQLICDLRSVSTKTLIRMSPAMKHTICKNCDTLLIESSTSSTQIENKSRGGKKPWADVLVKKCNTCGFEKRFPLAPARQKRRPFRQPKSSQIQNT